jgi:hypothetical protein
LLHIAYPFSSFDQIINRPGILDLVVEKSKPTLHHIHLLNANTGSKSASLGTDKDTDEPSLSEKVEDLFTFISLA